MSDGTAPENKLGITDADELTKAERYYSELRLKELAENPIKGAYDFEHLKAVHAYIVQDVYDWGGVERDQNLFKAERVLGGAPMDFADHKEIGAEVKAGLDALKAVPMDDLRNEEAAKAFAEATTMIWRAHPFWEGNTRATLTFVEAYAREQGSADRTGTDMPLAV